MLTRLITAIGLFLLLALLIGAPNWFMVLVCEVIVFFGLYEWTKICKMNDLNQGIIILIFMLLTLPSITKYIGIFDTMGIFGIFNIIPFLTITNIKIIQEFLIILAAIFWISYAPYSLYKKNKVNKGWQSKIIGVLMFTSVMLALVQLIDLSIENLLIAFAIPIIGDMVAFVIGKYFGQFQLTIISPKKTYEGLISGMIGIVFIGSFLLIKFLGIYWLSAILITLVTGIASVFGDLFISLSKRWAGVKDSGKILPGHGGILDRIDSFLATLPVFTVMLMVLG